MKKHIYILLFSLLLIACTTLAQDRTITGKVTDAASAQGLPGVTITIKGTTKGTATDATGNYKLLVSNSDKTLTFRYIGYKSKDVTIKKDSVINVALEVDGRQLEEVVVTGYSKRINRALAGKVIGVTAVADQATFSYAPPVFNTEEYQNIQESIFLEAKNNPLSTFSIDVDNASYSNVRRFINDGQLPPADAVRIEEMINYFDYDYPQPIKEHPFSVTTELAACPWNKENLLLHIGLQGKEIPTDNLPASNIVFLIDVSGSMMSEDKLPLVKSGFKMLVDQLRPQDKVAIVVYAGAAGLVLPSTNKKAEMLTAIEALEAGGSTAGAAGINLAYKEAEKHFIKGGNNRVILATDGDFNVGVSSSGELERLIEKKRETGVFLTVLGFGTGNLKDSRMEQLADKGNGNYAYIDNILEAKKVFVNEFGGTLFTIAKDVKLQLEFNPAHVQAYRLIGYENRALQNEDFNNDKKDAGDMGSGHSVTALYEIVPANSKNNKTELQKVDDLKYQQTQLNKKAATTNELLTLKLRYKEPAGSQSKLLQTIVTTQTIAPEKLSDNYKFSAAVAAYGMLLRDSKFKGSANYNQVLELAQQARGKDEDGNRGEFVKLVKAVQLMDMRASKK
ncbi:von Willebrand factor type A domain-containing protein [Pontibacter sp. KCTC 32443]|uniref:vWA domain-containing protein n=1 Tax=Pontibacter TaxID=323449 RepID=UPI00164EB656|nr:MULTISPECIES: von Willebrand factor type A domain-containing protein [Pontibacter]MBC5774758.1 von Willebrand factor type A domain-containing protein [Pontibacter sp. KCTC 32443]